MDIDELTMTCMDLCDFLFMHCESHAYVSPASARIRSAVCAHIPYGSGQAVVHLETWDVTPLRAVDGSRFHGAVRGDQKI